MDEPATPFWEGYHRSTAAHNTLIHAVAEALESHPTMRFGQILTIVLGDEDHWNTYDEEIGRMLQRFTHGT